MSGSRSLAGVTTFLTMAYIIFTHPNILEPTGMDKTALIAGDMHYLGAGDDHGRRDRQGPHRHGPWLGAQLDLHHVGRLGQNGLANRPGRGVPFGAIFPYPDGGRLAAKDRRSDPDVPDLSHRCRNRPVHHVHRTNGSGHRRRQPVHAGLGWAASRPRYSSVLQDYWS